jgi:hypothetical protein
MPLTRTRAARVVVLTLVALCLLVGSSGLPPAAADTGDVHTGEFFGREVWPGEKSTDLLVDSSNATEPATATFSNPKGVRRTMTIQPSCFSDTCGPDGPYDGYRIRWNGLGNGGAMQPVGQYEGALSFTDGGNQPQEVSMGTIYVGRLVTNRTNLYPAPLAKPDPSLASLSTIGKCSSVAGAAPQSQWTLRLLSLSHCSSRARTDDWAFEAQQLTEFNERGRRLVSVTIGAWGAPVRAGDRAGIVLDTSFGTSSTPRWRRVALLTREGHHMGTTFRVPPGTVARAPYHFLIQGRVTDGNRFRIRRWHAQLEYRMWTQ